MHLNQNSRPNPEMLTFTKPKAWFGSKFYCWLELCIMIHNTLWSQDLMMMRVGPWFYSLVNIKCLEKNKLMLKPYEREENDDDRQKPPNTSSCRAMVPAAGNSRNLHSYVSVPCHHFPPHGPRLVTAAFAMSMSNWPQPIQYLSFLGLPGRKLLECRQSFRSCTWRQIMKN